MGYKTILTVIDQTEESRIRLKTCLELKERFGAKLRAVSFGLAHTPMIMSEAYSPSMYEAESAAATEAAKEAIESAKTALGADADQVEFALVSGFATAAGAALAARALYADLVVLGPPDDDAPLTESLLEGALFDSPAPVLVLPTGWTGGPIGGSVTIAWDARKEASRATRAAMPFLKEASNVEVVTVTHSLGGEPYGEDPGVGFTGWLAHNGVSAELRQLEGSPVAQVLLSDIKDRGSKLVIMGGYGHSRLVESIFGGVTRDLLRKSPAPMLMAH